MRSGIIQPDGQARPAEGWVLALASGPPGRPTRPERVEGQTIGRSPATRGFRGSKSSLRTTGESEEYATVVPDSRIKLTGRPPAGGPGCARS
jgi:hypothetical protein